MSIAVVTQPVMPSIPKPLYLKMRARLYQELTRLDLWRGIRACVIAGAKFKDFAPYQIVWLYANRYGKRIQNCLVAARFASKSFLTLLAKLMKMASVPNTLVSWIPGGNLTQIKSPRRYFETLVRNSSVLSKMKAVPYQEMQKFLVNGSAIEFFPPTTDSVHSARGTDIVFDEGQDLDQEVLAEALPQLGASGAQLTFMGMSECDTIMDRAFHDRAGCFAMLVPIQEVVRAGIVTEKYVLHVMASDLLTQDQIDVMYHCVWKHKSDTVFAPDFVDSIPGTVVLGSEAWGIDFNPRAGHWATKSVRLTDGCAITIEERMCKEFQDILDLPPGRIFPEDGGTNTGYVDALILLNNRSANPRYIYRPMPNSEAEKDAIHPESSENVNDHFWTLKSKSRQVARMIYLQEHHQWLILRDACPALTKNVTIIPFNNKGLPDKDKADKLKLNAHVVDSNIHSVNGCLTLTNTEMYESIYDI